MRWGQPQTTELLLGGWAIAVSVGWLGLGLGWCALRRLERRYECSSAAEYWGVGVLCCIHERSSEREILMEDLGGEGSDTEDESSGAERLGGHEAQRRAKGAAAVQLFGGTK